MDFQAFADDIAYRGWDVHGAEIYRAGVLEHSMGDTVTPYPIYSATKSILSIAVGIASDTGRLSPGDRILDRLPADAVSAMTERQRESFGELTLERLMTMSVDGFPFRPEGDNYLEYSLACEIDHPERRVFNYSNISAYLVSAALTEAIGEDACAFIERNILEPLGIRGAVFSRSPEGCFYGASGMKLSVNQLSRVGLMLYAGGLYNGSRIVSERYIRRAVSPLQSNREGGYGYFFWKYRGGFSINGKWGQRCFVLPEEDLVITYLSHIENGSDALCACMEKNILSE